MAGMQPANVATPAAPVVHDPYLLDGTAGTQLAGLKPRARGLDLTDRQNWTQLGQLLRNDQNAGKLPFQTDPDGGNWWPHHALHIYSLVEQFPEDTAFLAEIFVKISTDC